MTLETLTNHLRQTGGANEWHCAQCQCTIFALLAKILEILESKNG